MSDNTETTKVKKDMSIVVLDNGAVVTMTGYQVTTKAKVKVQLPEFDLELPGTSDDTPEYVIKNAIASLWITIQDKLRPMTEQGILDVMSQPIDCSDLSKTFASRRVVKDPKAELISMVKAGKVSKEEAIELLMNMDD